MPEEKTIKIPPIPEDATIESIWEKLHHERKMWQNLIAEKDKQTQDTLSQIRQLNAEWMALFIRTYGSYNEKTKEYSVEVPAPDLTELWAYGADPTETGYLLRTKKVEV